MDNWGKLLNSVLSYLIFIATVSYICIWGVPAEVKDIINQVVGAEIAWVATTVNYWSGSSVGSASKDKTIRDQLDPSTPKPT